MTHVDQHGNPVTHRAMATAKIGLLLVFAATVFPESSSAGELVPPSGLEGYFADEDHSANFKDLTLHYLNELSARRRLTTVFPNEQNPFYGVQLNYVNVGEGNLTFHMRDLVRGDRIPIVFGRVYDSRKSDEADFGKGWKLSVEESLHVSGNRLIYTDAGNSTYVLQTDGSRIWSAHPHLTGIAGGYLGSSRAVIRSGNLEKTFQGRGGEFLLMEVTDRSGNWLRLTYAGGAISRIQTSSGRYVEIDRDRSMKIILARDDAGRSTRYVYDRAGSLVESIGGGGGVTQYRYDESGLLARVLDSRDTESIAARFYSDGRVAAVDSQHDRMTYEYGARTTTVRNARQRASVATFHESGLVESITDFAGGITILQFTDDLRVRQLSFDGAIIARARYDNDRVAVVERHDSYSPSAQRFYYDQLGRLTSVVRNREAVAQYRYDRAGRVTYARDSSGSYSGAYGSHGHAPGGGQPRAAAGRGYAYDVRGDLRGVTMNGVSLGFRTNRLGMIEQVTWAGNRVLDLAYADSDRVQTLRFGDDEVSLGSEFEYDAAGFRVLGRYDVLKGISDGEVNLDYDAVGNLVSMELPRPDGTAHVVDHTIGSKNQLLLMTPRGAEMFQQAIEYDESGRAVRAVQGTGQRDAVFRYDELGRLADVYLDREHVLTSQHGPMDLDPVHSMDDYSAITPVSEPVASGIFGSLDEIVYTRPIGTPYGIARFVPEMARFVILAQPVIPPDSLVLASLRRRNLASDGALNPSPLLGFDKPSSSLFLPPEFFASNCVGCVGGASGFQVSRVGSGPIVTGQTINFTAQASYAYCYFWYFSGWDIYTINYPYTHVVEFLGGGGSGSGAYSTGGPSLSFSGSYSTAGAKTVSDTLSCSCASIFLAQAQAQVEACPIGPVTPHQPDPYPLDTANLTAATQTALTCLQGAVAQAGGTFTVTSAYRPQSYQDHLREVWDKYQVVSGWPPNTCPVVRDNVLAEWALHGLVAQPAAMSSHTSRTAFDGNWTLPAGQNIDTLASGCGLSRPVAGDPVHFEFTTI